MNPFDPEWCGCDIGRLIIENMSRIKFMNTSYQMALI